jgi:protein ImuB
MRREFSARDKPLVTAMMQGQRRILASVDEAAARVGLSVGMTVTHAQSLIPDLTVSEATPEEDEAALFRLALWCIKYSPLVTPNPPDGVFIDVAGRVTPTLWVSVLQPDKRSADVRPAPARVGNA